jgi:hypothetical protein
MFFLFSKNLPVIITVHIRQLNMNKKDYILLSLKKSRANFNKKTAVQDVIFSYLNAPIRVLGEMILLGDMCNFNLFLLFWFTGTFKGRCKQDQKATNADPD